MRSNSFNQCLNFAASKSSIDGRKRHRFGNLQNRHYQERTSSVDSRLVEHENFQPSLTTRVVNNSDCWCLKVMIRYTEIVPKVQSHGRLYIFCCSTSIFQYYRFFHYKPTIWAIPMEAPYFLPWMATAWGPPSGLPDADAVGVAGGARGGWSPKGAGFDQGEKRAYPILSTYLAIDLSIYLFTYLIYSILFELFCLFCLLYLSILSILSTYLSIERSSTYLQLFTYII